ncbi:hypothetical protein ABZ621_33000 [Streptomyces sp. NPDC007863]|uniref:hypothetical protein n=1 Tax=Streptomyces sp. NPDC007863 TaxID=3154894 RepID=UPI00340B5487
MTTATGTHPRTHAHTDPTWWKAPLVATLPGLPLLVGGFATFWADGYTSGFEILLTLAGVLLAMAWLLPHRRALRWVRTAAASTALLLLAAPWALAVLMVLAMASG